MQKFRDTPTWKSTVAPYTIAHNLLAARSEDPIKMKLCSDSRIGNTRSLHFTLAEYTFNGELFHTLGEERKKAIIRQKVSKYFANGLEKQYYTMHTGRGCTHIMQCNDIFTNSKFYNRESKKFWFGFKISIFPEPCPGNVIHFWLDCIGWYDSLNDSVERSIKTCDDIMTTLTLTRLAQIDEYANAAIEQCNKFESIK